MLWVNKDWGPSVVMGNSSGFSTKLDNFRLSTVWKQRRSGASTPLSPWRILPITPHPSVCMPYPPLPFPSVTLYAPSFPISSPTPPLEGVPYNVEFVDDRKWVLKHSQAHKFGLLSRISSWENTEKLPLNLAKGLGSVLTSSRYDS